MQHLLIVETFTLRPVYTSEFETPALSENIRLLIWGDTFPFLLVSHAYRLKPVPLSIPWPNLIKRLGTYFAPNSINLTELGA